MNPITPDAAIEWLERKVQANECVSLVYLSSEKQFAFIAGKLYRHDTLLLAIKAAMEDE